MLPRAIPLLLAAITACGTSPDDRPATLEVITLEILAPSCGQVQCHSTTTPTQGYAFDTVASAKVALQSLVTGTGTGRHHRSLMSVLTDSGTSRMPPDAPLEAADIALINTWIAAGAPGL